MNICICISREREKESHRWSRGPCPDPCSMIFQIAQKSNITEQNIQTTWLEKALCREVWVACLQLMQEVQSRLILNLHLTKWCQPHLDDPKICVHICIQASTLEVVAKLPLNSRHSRRRLHSCPSPGTLNRCTWYGMSASLHTYNLESLSGSDCMSSCNKSMDIRCTWCCCTS